MGKITEILKNLSDWDRKTTKKIVSISSKRIKFFEFIAISGNTMPWLLVSILFFVFDVFISRSLNLFQLALIVVLTLLVVIFKTLAKRIRPIDSVSQKFLTPFDFKSDHTLRPFSFPSGHTLELCVLL
ncbi:MAG: hypothetical protein ACTSSF_06995 [Candidatus Heimdallarchaeaceae archaeon]